LEGVKEKGKDSGNKKTEERPNRERKLGENLPTAVRRVGGGMSVKNSKRHGTAACCREKIKGRTGKLDWGQEGKKKNGAIKTSNKEKIKEGERKINENEKGTGGDRRRGIKKGALDETKRGRDED